MVLVQVDGDTSTNDTVIALASGLSGSPRISSLQSHEAVELQAGLDAVTAAKVQLVFFMSEIILLDI